MRRALGSLLFVLVAACAAPAVTQPTAERVVAPDSEPAGLLKAAGIELEPADPMASSKATGVPGSPVAEAPSPAEQSAPVPAPVPPRISGPTLAAPGEAPSLVAFGGLGAWLDVFDHTDDPKTVIPLIQGAAKRGVRTLYIESSRYTSKTDIQYPKALGAALDEAKARGMRAVAWYPPGLKDVTFEVKRSLAAIRFVSPRGNRFDAFGADIEYTQAVPNHAERNKRAIDYTKRLRAAVGTNYPLAAIVIPPHTLERDTSRWPGFPWKTLAQSYNLFMPMNYWTAFGKSSTTASDLTRYNTEKTRSLTGRPVHNIGGLGDSADRKQVAAYVKAAKAAGSLGGGLYDYTTTRSDVWGELAKLNA